MARLIRAAGGVVWRVVEHRLEVLVIHRPRYDDWSLPKGKADDGDADEAHTALREVHEETGYRCALGRELPSVTYLDRRGREKVVRYWEMRPVVEDGFVATPEVDQVRWVELAAAERMLTYESDRDVLAAFATYAGHVV